MKQNEDSFSFLRSFEGILELLFDNSVLEKTKQNEIHRYARPKRSEEGGGVLPSNGLLGMCRWMGSNFHD